MAVGWLITTCAVNKSSKEIVPEVHVLFLNASDTDLCNRTQKLLKLFARKQFNDNFLASVLFSMKPFICPRFWLKIRQVAEKGDTAESVENVHLPQHQVWFLGLFEAYEYLKGRKTRSFSRDLQTTLHDHLHWVNWEVRIQYNFWTMSVMTVFLCCSLQKFYPSADVLQIGKDCHSEICIISHSEKQAKQHWMRTARSLTGRGGPWSGTGCLVRGGGLLPGGGWYPSMHWSGPPCEQNHTHV